jgi:hypothetical protein
MNLHAQRIFIIGYGSLFRDANRRQTYFQHVPGHLATLDGFERVFDKRSYPMRATSLGVRQAAGVRLPIVLVEVDIQTFPFFDSREIDNGYDQTQIDYSLVKGAEDLQLNENDQMILYMPSSRSDQWGHTYHALSSREYPVLQSYIDAIIGGFLIEGLSDIARQFMATTRWDDVVLENDRKEPRYVRGLTSHEYQEYEIADQVDQLMREYDLSHLLISREEGR